MWTTPEALRERQPHRDERSGCSLVLDGRVDNREALAAELRAAGAVLREDTDAELVLRACQTWGEEAPRRMLGDFAFALWDERSQSVFCARDILGVRPFHYVLEAGHFLFASELRQLLRDSRTRRELNEAMFAELLAASIHSFDETLYRGILRLPPAHWMKIGRDGRARIRRYWDIDFSAHIRHPHEQDYAAHLLDILKQSVACRLRVNGSVGTELSGGLDSSTVSCLARASDAGREIQSYSVTYAGMTCDESDFIRALAAHTGIPCNLAEYRSVGLDAFAGVARRHADFPGQPVAISFLQAIVPLLHRNRCRVVLTGLGGDEWLTGEAEMLADFLARLDFGSLQRELPAASAWWDTSSFRGLLRFGIKPWLKRVPGASRLQRLRLRPPAWLAPSWIRKNRLMDRMVPRWPRDAHASCAQLARHAWAFAAESAHGHETGNRLVMDSGIEQRHPLLDRRLIEYACSIPQELHLQQGLSKSLLRKAMGPLLPPVVHERRTKAGFTAVNIQTIDRVIQQEPVSSWPVVRAGWVDGLALESLYTRERRNFLEGKRYGGRVILATWMACAAGLVMNGHGNPPGYT
jgi:asparagine synthase (glutamine-hydrolysing)